MWDCGIFARTDCKHEERHAQVKCDAMANLLDNVENSIWHAFDYLALDGDGTAPKAKLKVRTRLLLVSLSLSLSTHMLLHLDTTMTTPREERRCLRVRRESERH